jgi:hypothetical protein
MLGSQLLAWTLSCFARTDFAPGVAMCRCFVVLNCALMTTVLPLFCHRLSATIWARLNEHPLAPSHPLDARYDSILVDEPQLS